MDHFKESWEIIKPDLVPWVVLFLVFSILNSFTGGLAVLLIPNLYRTCRDALREQRAPEIGDLFNFDEVGDDIVTMVLQYIANMVGALFCGIGALVTGVLFFWAPMLAAEGEFAPVDAMKASMAHAKANFGEIFMFLLVGMILNFVGVLVCCVGILVTVPVTFVAMWRFFEQHKAAIMAAADAEGLARKA